MQTKVCTIRALELPADIEKLVVMWQASDDQWPGTWSGGVEITTKMIREWHAHINMLNIYVAETADKSKLVGYCSLSERPEEKNTAYLAVLNVQPDCQGQSIGRRLVQQCVERSTELGFHFLSIGTWSGNLKSVPTYKKCGYFWKPDTSVYMENYIPPIRQLACARAYFSRHNWYTTFKRELSQKEDDERWEGMKTYAYHWEQDGDSLSVWVDREAQRLTAVETDTFFAGAMAGDIEPAKGMSTTLRWRISNKQERSMSVSLIASGTEHIQVEKRATLTVAPGETQEFEATVDVALDTPDVRPHHRVPSVRSLFIIDGEVLELGTGLRPQKAVHVSTAPDYVTLFPGVAKTLHVQLQSYLKEDVAATVSLAPTPGISTDWTEKTITIPAKSFAALPLTAQADAGGVYPLRVTVYFEGGQTEPTTLPLFSLPAGGVLAYQSKKETRLENEWTRLILKPKAGRASLAAAQTGVGLASFRERVGPPFGPNELDEKDFTITLQKAIGSITAVMTVDLNDQPGLTLRRELTLNGGPLLKVSSVLINKGTQPREVQTACWVQPQQGKRATFTVPLKHGRVQSRQSEFPAAEEDVGSQPEDFAERWASYSTERGGILGLLWPATLKKLEFSPWGIDFISQKMTCPPQHWTPVGTFYFYAGPGDWRAVRAHARRVAGDSHAEPIPATTRAVHDVRFDPAPLLTLEDAVKTQLVVDNLRNRPMIGQVDLSMPEGLTADRTTFTFNAITIKNTLREDITVTLPKGITAYTVDARLQTRTANEHIAVPVMRLGQPTAVEVTAADNHTWRIDNGRARFGIAPGFSASLFQWEVAGVNHAYSSYPEQTPFDWISPWYGGITPVAMRPGDHDFPGKLHSETFTGAAVDVPDARGIPWRGVRVSADLQREWLRGLRVEVDYLTVGQSNVLKLIYHIHNSTTAKRSLIAGWLSFWQPDGSHQHNVLHAAGLQRQPNTWDSWADTDYWSAVSNGETGRSVMQVSPYPNVGYIDWGAGGHLSCYGTVEVLPESSVERVVYLALCPDLTTAKRYIALKDVK